MPQKNNFSAVILSAGFSSRMKQAKFSLMFDKRRTFLEKIVQEYKLFGCKEIVVVMNKNNISLKDELNLSFHKEIKFVVNFFPERERFFSLQCGINALNVTDFTFIQNIDNPFINEDILLNLSYHKDKAELIIPVFKGKGGHPILISGKIADAINSEKDYSVNLKDFLKRFSNKRIEQKNDLTLQNINTKYLYNKFFNIKV